VYRFDAAIPLGGDFSHRGLRERIGPWHLAAIAALVWGQAILGGGAAGIRPGSGKAMIFAATLLWAVETVIARKLLTGLSALTVAAARMGGGAVDVTALLVPGAIITALLQAGSKALAPQWPGLALVAAGGALVLLTARRRRTAGVR
jgi:hypothetical protein